MSANRFQMLMQAQRNLDLAFLLDENGDHFGAANNMAAARSLIFTQSTNQPPSRSVAAHSSNTGSCGAGPDSLLTA